MSHNKNYIRLINSARWVKLRRQKIRANPFCEECLKKGRFVAADEVHHIRPVESSKDFQRMSELAYDYANLRSLCHDCHREAHQHRHKRKCELKRESKYEAIRRAVRERLSNVKKA